MTTWPDSHSELRWMFQGLTECPDCNFIDSNNKALERIFVYCLFATMKDKESYDGFVSEIGCDVFGKDLYDAACTTPKHMVSFLRDDIYDEDEILIEEAPS